MKKQLDPIKRYTGIGALFRLTFPIVLMTALESVYSLVDGIVVSYFDGAYALAAIQIVFPLTLLINAIGYLVGYGMESLVHLKLKLEDRKKANELLGAGFIITMLATLVISLLVLLFDHEIYYLLGAKDEEVLHECLHYGNIVIGGSVFTTLFIYLKSLFTEAYSYRLGVTVTIISGLCNMLLDILLTGILQIGIRGAALATVGSFVIGVAVLLIYHIVNRKKANLYFTTPRLSRRDLKRFVRLGLSHMMQFVGAAVVALIFNLQAGRYAGVLGFASVMVVMHIHMLFTAVIQGFIEGLEPEMHHQHEEHHNDLLRSIILRSIFYISVFSLLVFGFSQLLCHAIVYLFSVDNAEFAFISENAYRLYAYGVILYGINLFIHGFLHSAQLKISASISSVCLPVLKIACFFVLPILWEEQGVWMAVPMAELIALGVSIVLFVLGYNHESLRKKRIRKIV